MLNPRIESLGMQRRRAVNAHQGALLVHGAGSVAPGGLAPLTHVKGFRTVKRRMP
jgi:hypothetical protein